MLSTVYQKTSPWWGCPHGKTSGWWAPFACPCHSTSLSFMWNLCQLSSRSHLWTWRNGWWYWKSHYLSFCWMKHLNMWPVTTWNLVKIVCGLPPKSVLCQHAPKEFPGRLCSLLCPWLSGFTAQTLTLVICFGLDWHDDKFYIQRKKFNLIFLLFRATVYFCWIFTWTYLPVMEVS